MWSYMYWLTLTLFWNKHSVHLGSFCVVTNCASFLHSGNTKSGNLRKTAKSSCTLWPRGKLSGSNKMEQSTRSETTWISMVVNLNVLNTDSDLGLRNFERGVLLLSNHRGLENDLEIFMYCHNNKIRLDEWWPINAR